MLTLFKSKKMKKIFLRRKLTIGEQVEFAKGHAEEALDMFSQAHKKLDNANELLNKTLEDATYQAKELLKQAERAEDEIRMNKAVQNKLSEFVVPSQV